MSNKYTNTVQAAAYSLSVDIELLQQALEPLRKATELRKEMAKKGPSNVVSPEWYTIIVQVNKDIHVK